MHDVKACVHDTCIEYVWIDVVLQSLPLNHAILWLKRPLECLSRSPERFLAGVDRKNTGWGVQTAYGQVLQAAYGQVLETAYSRPRML